MPRGNVLEAARGGPCEGISGHPLPALVGGVILPVGNPGNLDS